MAVLTASGQAATIIWGSEVYSDLLDSKGTVMDSTFSFELGAFDNGFTPTLGNLGSWSAHWNVFDGAIFNEADDYFTSKADLLANGTSTSPETLLRTITSFAGRPAYLWIRNAEVPVEGTEVLLTRASNWTFLTSPPSDANCCDEALPLQWSVSDLAKTEVPVYGYQKTSGGDRQGTGIITYTGDYPSGAYLQSASVPEPGGSVLVLVLGLLAVHDRRRVRNY
jgi:hypothetical protein